MRPKLPAGATGSRVRGMVFQGETLTPEELARRIRWVQQAMFDNATLNSAPWWVLHVRDDMQSLYDLSDEARDVR